ncbi:MAG: biotin carboxylase N-terminal domain-containing protein [Rhodospirillales bacterium]
MFRKILIADRGDAAFRVHQSARGMGIRTVALYAESELFSLHAEAADEAIRLDRDGVGGDQEWQAIIRACERTGAEAVHPGCGPLAADADFAAALEEAGIAFIGATAGVLSFASQRERLRASLERAGLPLHSDFAGLIPCDNKMLAQKGRQLEIQVLADDDGNVVHCLERDVSLHLKGRLLLAEAPAEDLGEDMRDRMGDLACRVAEALGWVGAATVHFQLDKDHFSVIGLSAGLNPAHPVTELVTGDDLVALQFRIAAGEPLGRIQEEITLSGHALALFITDLTDPGLPRQTVRRFRLPDLAPFGGTVRVDTGVREGDAAESGSVLAKIMAWAEDRPSALQRLAGVLADTELTGPVTDLDPLRGLLDDDQFRAAPQNAAFIAGSWALFNPQPRSTPPEVVIAAVLDRLLVGPIEEVPSPLHVTLDDQCGTQWAVGATLLQACPRVSEFDVKLGQGDREKTAHTLSAGLDDDGVVFLVLDGHRTKYSVERMTDQVTVFDGRRSWILRPRRLE